MDVVGVVAIYCQVAGLIGHCHKKRAVQARFFIIEDALQAWFFADHEFRL